MPCFLDLFRHYSSGPADLYGLKLCRAFGGISSLNFMGETLALGVASASRVHPGKCMPRSVPRDSSLILVQVPSSFLSYAKVVPDWDRIFHSFEARETLYSVQSISSFLATFAISAMHYFGCVHSRFACIPEHSRIAPYWESSSICPAIIFSA